MLYYDCPPDCNEHDAILCQSILIKIAIYHAFNLSINAGCIVYEPRYSIMVEDEAVEQCERKARNPYKTEIKCAVMFVADLWPLSHLRVAFAL